MKVGSFAAILASFVIGLPAAIVLLFSSAEPCSSAGAPAASAAAANGIPANYLALYQDAGEHYGLPWTLLAAIASVETDHGRLHAAGVTSGANSAGAMGPMQFLEGTWRAYGVDGDGDGDRDVYDPRDAIPGAANYLRASGAPGNLHDAIFAYNHAEWYVQKVLTGMRLYAASSPAEPADRTTPGPAGGARTVAAGSSHLAVAPSGGCGDLGGVSVTGASGAFTLAPRANRPGVALSAAMTAYVARMATFYEGRLIVTTGTKHSRLTVSGNVSDHWAGNGVDFGMAANGGTNDGPVGDAIAGRRVYGRRRAARGRNRARARRRREHAAHQQPARADHLEGRRCRRQPPRPRPCRHRARLMPTPRPRRHMGARRAILTAASTSSPSRSATCSSSAAPTTRSRSASCSSSAPPARLMRRRSEPSTPLSSNCNEPGAG